VTIVSITQQHFIIQHKILKRKEIFMYYSYPCNQFRQQGMNMNQMGTMPDMGQMSQMPQGTQAQQPMFNQMPTMPMQPMMPMGQMGQGQMGQMGQMDQTGAMTSAQLSGAQVGAPMGGAMGAPMGGAAGAATPLGTTTGSQPTNIGSIPPSAVGFQQEQPVFDTQFTQGYLRTQIGRRVRVEFLLGTNTMQDRAGTLVDVGISYIIINEEETDDLLLCDIYSIKFVRFYF
jgi:hypothetical protein